MQPAPLPAACFPGRRGALDPARHLRSSRCSETPWGKITEEETSFLGSSRRAIVCPSLEGMSPAPLLTRAEERSPPRVAALRRQPGGGSRCHPVSCCASGCMSLRACVCVSVRPHTSHPGQKRPCRAVPRHATGCPCRPALGARSVRVSWPVQGCPCGARARCRWLPPTARPPN